MAKYKPANDAGVPADEMLLAELIQNAVAHDVRACRGTLNDSHGNRCALGAYRLETAGAGKPGLVAGNDGWSRGNLDVYYDAGATYYEIMQPGTRW